MMGSFSNYILYLKLFDNILVDPFRSEGARGSWFLLLLLLHDMCGRREGEGPSHAWSETHMQLAIGKAAHAG